MPYYSGQHAITGGHMSMVCMKMHALCTSDWEELAGFSVFGQKPMFMSGNVDHYILVYGSNIFYIRNKVFCLDDKIFHHFKKTLKFRSLDTIDIKYPTLSHKNPST